MREDQWNRKVSRVSFGLSKGPHHVVVPRAQHRMMNPTRLAIGVRPSFTPQLKFVLASGTRSPKRSVLSQLFSQKETHLGHVPDDVCWVYTGIHGMCASPKRRRFGGMSPERAPACHHRTVIVSHRTNAFIAVHDFSKSVKWGEKEKTRHMAMGHV